MFKIISAFTFMTVMLSSQAYAETAKPLYVIKSVNIDAPAEKTWAKISNFGDLGAWHPAVAKTEITGGKNNHKGAKRLLTLQDGGTIKETLTAYDASHQTMSYTISESVLPVNEYYSTLHVYTNGANRSVVVWEGHFLPKAPNDEKTASDTVSGIYDAGLANLKKITE